MKRKKTRASYLSPAEIKADRERYTDTRLAAYPPGLDEAVSRLRAGDLSGMESILSFFEADPFFHGTGYLKEKLAFWIKPEMLTSADAMRLRQVILSVVDRRNQRDFGAFCRLARKVDSSELRQGLYLRLDSDDPLVRRRARWMLNFLETNGNQTRQ